MKKKYTYQQALQKAQKYCAYQERSHQEVRDKLYHWGLHKSDVENAISQLITEDFLNEERFARAYARGKFRMKQWGRRKIMHGLKKKKTSEYCIKRALKEINEEKYRNTLLGLAEKKLENTKEKNHYKRNKKVADYCIGKGYEPKLVWEAIKTMEANTRWKIKPSN